MDWRLLGIGTTKLDPWDQTRSKTKQDQFNKSLRPATNRYLKDTFIPWIRPLLPSETEVFLSKSVDQGVEIHYPALFSSSYIPNRLLLEIGPLASWIPSVWKEIMPDVSRHFPNAIGEPPIPVRVTTAERTFWEKTTIAHQIAYNKKTPPPRYSRHYYDLVMLKRGGIAESAICDLGLLQSVAEFKGRFYPSTSARYDLACPGTLRLLPDQKQQNALISDYKKMQPMFFRDPPIWDNIIQELKYLEERINEKI